MQKSPLVRVRQIEAPLCVASRMISAALLVVSSLEREDDLGTDNAMALRTVLLKATDDLDRAQRSASEWADELMISRASGN